MSASRNLNDRSWESREAATGVENALRSKTAAELAAARIARDPERLLRDAALVQSLLENLRSSTLAHATPEERAREERYQRIRRQCGLEPLSLEHYALTKIVDDPGTPEKHRAIAQAELDRRERNFRWRLSKGA